MAKNWNEFEATEHELRPNYATKTNGMWQDSPPREAARNRNWALYVARGMYATVRSTQVFKRNLSPFMYKMLCNVLNDVCWELEQRYPDSPTPKRIKRRKGI